MPARKGPISQRNLVPILIGLIDAARAKTPSAHRDLARRSLRELRQTTQWNTPFVCHNLGPRRCQYLKGLGWEVEMRWLFSDAAWHTKHG
jgi:hypothetical protein